VIVPQLRQQHVERFDFLGGLPGGIAPTNIDALIERRGHFLAIECKRPQERMPRGQARAFGALAGLETFHVMLVIGQPPATIESFGYWGCEQHAASVHTVRDEVRGWLEWASL